MSFERVCVIHNIVFESELSKKNLYSHTLCPLCIKEGKK